MDPVLTVPCPTCEAAAGRTCREKRPSGYAHSLTFCGKARWGHDARDLAADGAGAYDHDCRCPIHDVSTWKRNCPSCSVAEERPAPPVDVQQLTLLP